MKKEYSNGEITVVWQPDKCIHSGICAHGLPSVFRPRQVPWVDIQAEASQAIAEQIAKCPSGALSLKAMNNE